MAAFFSREPSSAQKYFTTGRVFMMLWDIGGVRPDLCEVADDDPTIGEDRRYIMGAEGVYTGPFVGPETVRSFIVISPGSRSSLCL